MAKFKVLDEFIDKETKKHYQKGDTADLTVARADEINKALKDRQFLERIKEKKKK